MQDKHRLRAERNNCGYTQKALGARADVSPSTISHIECHRGPDVPSRQRATTKTKQATAQKLAVALGCIKPGVYTVEQFARKQKIFTAVELFEDPSNVRKRELARQRRTNRRHLRVA